MQRTMVFDRLRLDSVNRAAEVHETASGKSLNVVRVLHALGDECVAGGFVGGDSGRFIRDELDRAGVPHDFVTVAPKTRTCVTILDRASGETTELVEESKEVEKPAWGKLRGRVAEWLPRAKVMVLSGSLTPNAPQDFYGFCVNRATEHAASAIVDAAGEPLRRALAARPLVVKPNRAELARTLDSPIESDAALRDAIRRLIELGPGWCVVTQGKEGAIVSDGQRFWRVRSPALRAVNPIGSGDSVAAGLASAIARGQRLPEAARLGIACGAANAMTLLPGHVRPDDVAQLVEKIELEDWG
jgi:tagatose 6-phosphate kinase